MFVRILLKPCPECKGQKSIPLVVDNYIQFGMIDEQECPRCNGVGYVPLFESYEMN